MCRPSCSRVRESSSAQDGEGVRLAGKKAVGCTLNGCHVEFARRRQGVFAEVRKALGNAVLDLRRPRRVPARRGAAVASRAAPRSSAHPDDTLRLETTYNTSTDTNLFGTLGP